MSDALLEVRDLRVTFRAASGLLGGGGEVVRAVDGVSFAIGPGEVLALVGESGSGKSTLARALLGLTPRVEGEVRLWPRGASRAIDLLRARGTELAQARREMQIVFQDPSASLDPRMSIGASIAEPLRAHALARGAERERRVAELLDSVGLARACAARFPHELSGGQCQRAAFARALAVRPQLLICDEVLSALDVSIQAQMLVLLARLVRDTGLACLFISHDLAAARWLADRVAVMYCGRLVEIGPSGELLVRPAHPYTAALLAAAPRLDPDLPASLRLAGEAPSPARRPSGCAFHPRCPRAIARCAADDPPELDQGGGWRASCWLASEAASDSARGAGS
jgi:oligopeptide/dipeptide ABC transporter ATP-binding protein